MKAVIDALLVWKLMDYHNLEQDELKYEGIGFLHFCLSAVISPTFSSFP